MRQILSTLTLLVLAGTVNAADWGDLTMTFKLDGKAPKAKPLVVNKDQQFCGKFGLVDESLVVNKDNNGIANVIVYIYQRPGSKAVPVHPDYDETADAEIVMDNKKCRFEPRVAVLRTSQNLVIKNSDVVGHNTNYATFANNPDNVLIPAGGQLERKLTSEERLPAKVACNIHPWMTGWFVVKSHPYVGVSDKDGKLSIKNMPAGKWTLQVWQEKSGYVKEVTLNGKKTSWKRGRVEVTIKPGKNDLGEVAVPLSLFEKD